MVIGSHRDNLILSDLKSKFTISLVTWWKTVLTTVFSCMGGGGGREMPALLDLPYSSSKIDTALLDHWKMWKLGTYCVM